VEGFTWRKQETGQPRRFASSYVALALSYHLSLCSRFVITTTTILLLLFCTQKHKKKKKIFLQKTRIPHFPLLNCMKPPSSPSHNASSFCI